MIPHAPNEEVVAYALSGAGQFNRSPLREQ